MAAIFCKALCAPCRWASQGCSCMIEQCTHLCQVGACSGSIFGWRVPHLLTSAFLSLFAICGHSQCLSDCTSRCCAAFHECADACCSSCARCFNSCCEGCFDIMAAACGAMSSFVSNMCQRPFSCCTFLGVAGNIFSLVAFVVLLIKQGEFVTCAKPYEYVLMHRGPFAVTPSNRRCHDV
jgi:hypothetical protein